MDFPFMLQLHGGFVSVETAWRFHKGKRRVPLFRFGVGVVFPMAERTWPLEARKIPRKHKRLHRVLEAVAVIRPTARNFADVILDAIVAAL